MRLGTEWYVHFEDYGQLTGFGGVDFWWYICQDLGGIWARVAVRPLTFISVHK